MIETMIIRLLRNCRLPGRDRLARRLYPPNRSALRYLKGVYARRDGLLMQLDSRNHIDWVTLFHGDFEPEITRLIRRWLGPGGVFVDIGANIGCHTWTAASLVGASGLVLAFEPNPPVRNALEENLRLNEFDHRVKVHACALGSTSDCLLLRVPTLDSAEGSNMGLASLVALETPHTLVEVPVERLDDIFATADVQRCDLIKIDVQGYEAEVLAGSHSVLVRHRPLLILEWEAWAWEQANTSLVSVKDSLAALGYSIYQLLPNGKLVPVDGVNNLPAHADLIGIHREDTNH